MGHRYMPAARSVLIVIARRKPKQAENSEKNKKIKINEKSTGQMWKNRVY